MVYQLNTQTAPLIRRSHLTAGASLGQALAPLDAWAGTWAQALAQPGRPEARP